MASTKRNGVHETKWSPLKRKASSERKDFHGKEQLK